VCSSDIGCVDFEAELEIMFTVTIKARALSSLTEFTRRFTETNPILLL